VQPDWLENEFQNVTSPVLPQFMENFDPIGPVRLILESQITDKLALSNSCVLVPPVAGSMLDEKSEFSLVDTEFCLFSL
jgi:hypothetical protein